MKKLGIDQWGSIRDEGWNIRSGGEVANVFNKIVAENDQLKKELEKYKGESLNAMKRKKLKKPKRFVLQYKFPNHQIWQASEWSSNSEEDAMSKANCRPFPCGYGEERLWDRRKRKELPRENGELNHE